MGAWCSEQPFWGEKDPIRYPSEIGMSRSPSKMPWTRELDRVQDLVPFDLVLVVGDGSSVSQVRELP